ncbi:MAG: hypothetical protein LBS83_02425 [Holosporales bacterium]|nr:hypothetical protein [Holosporales bacterium]
MSFKGFAAIKSAFFGGPSMLLARRNWFRRKSNILTATEITKKDKPFLVISF